MCCFYDVFYVVKVLEHAIHLAGSSQSPSSDYVYVGTPEETILETYFVMLAKFNFDKAKEQCVSTSNAQYSFVSSSSLRGGADCVAMTLSHHIINAL